MSVFDYDEVFRRILSRNRWGSEGALAKELGVSPNTWTSYKKGKSSFGLHEIVKICDVLDVAPRWLLLGEDSAGQPSLYSRVERIVADVYAMNSIPLPSVALASTAASYVAMLDQELLSTTDSEEVDLRLRLLVKRIQKDIQNAQAEPGTGKRSAS